MNRKFVTNAFLLCFVQSYCLTSDNRWANCLRAAASLVDPIRDALADVKEHKELEADHVKSMSAGVHAFSKDCLQKVLPDASADCLSSVTPLTRDLYEAVQLIMEKDFTMAGLRVAAVLNDVNNTMNKCNCKKADSNCIGAYSVAQFSFDAMLESENVKDTRFDIITKILKQNC